MAFDIKKNPQKIMILATGAGWEHSPVVSDYTIYCLNDYIRTEKYGVKPDILFLMDILDEKPQIVSGIDNLGDVINRINKMGVPFIAPFKYEEIPLSQAFPLEECVKQFGLPYFTNTICYMIAYALLQGAKDIELFGVNQAGSHEYTEERGGVEWWLGIANGLGVRITVNGKNSQLLRYKGRYGGTTGILYGYLQTYDQIIDGKKRFGEPIIRRLFAPKPNVARSIKRRVNYES